MSLAYDIAEVFERTAIKRGRLLIPQQCLLFHILVRNSPSPPRARPAAPPLSPSLSIVFERLRSSPQLSVVLPTWWVFFCQLRLLRGWTANADRRLQCRPCGGTPRGRTDVDGCRCGRKIRPRHIRHTLMCMQPCRWKLMRRSLQMLIQVHAQSPSLPPAVEKPFTDRAVRCQALKWI